MNMVINIGGVVIVGVLELLWGSLASGRWSVGRLLQFPIGHISESIHGRIFIFGMHLHHDGQLHLAGVFYGFDLDLGTVT